MSHECSFCSYSSSAIGVGMHERTCKAKRFVEDKKLVSNTRQKMLKEHVNPLEEQLQKERTLLQEKELLCEKLQKENEKLYNTFLNNKNNTNNTTVYNNIYTTNITYNITIQPNDTEKFMEICMKEMMQAWNNSSEDTKRLLGKVELANACLKYINENADVKSKQIASIIIDNKPESLDPSTRNLIENVVNKLNTTIEQELK